MSTELSGGAAQARPLRPRSRRRVWLKRGLVGIVTTVTMLGCLGAIYQALAAAADRRTYLPPGELVDVDARSIHLQVMGQATGRPTVLLDAGSASFSSNWAWVQTELAGSMRVVAYDRAGLGWSDPAPEPQDAQQSARDLHAALQAAGIPGPYVTAGHSYGGLVVRAFADLYPQEVVGMVLVDASHPDQWAHIPTSRGGGTVALSNRVSAVLASLGILRLFKMNASLTAGLPDRPAAEMQAFLDRPGAWSTSAGVLGIWEARTRPEINRARNLGNLLLVVVGVTEQAIYAEVLTKLQAELPALSSNSLQLTVQGATHESLIAQREHALIVAQAIRQVLDASESGNQLVPQ
jgi:pimeloyl-ACP methyl ester carboxylesterase